MLGELEQIKLGIAEDRPVSPTDDLPTGDYQPPQHRKRPQPQGLRHLSRRQFLGLGVTGFATAILAACSRTDTPKGDINEQKPQFQQPIRNPHAIQPTSTAVPTSEVIPAPTQPPNATEAPIPAETVESLPYHIGAIRLEQSDGEFTAPEITLDLSTLSLKGRPIPIVDEQGNQLPLVLHIQPRVWRAGDSISPLDASESIAESGKNPNTKEYTSSDGTGHDSIVQRGEDFVIELHSWRSRGPNGEAVIQPGELFKLILDGPDKIITENGQQFIVSQRTTRERQAIIDQLTGQAFTISQINYKGKKVTQKVKIKWIYTPTPPTVTRYYLEDSMTVRNMIETDYKPIPKQESGEIWLQLCTPRTAEQQREVEARGKKEPLIDRTQTLTIISIIPVADDQ